MCAKCTKLRATDELFHLILTDEITDAIVTLIPDEWLQENESERQWQRKKYLCGFAKQD